MFKLHIGEVERVPNDLDENWINQQINRQREDKEVVCVKVFIKQDDIDLILFSKSCGGAGGGLKSLTRKEEEVIDLWKKRGMNDKDFTGGNLVAFLKQLKKYLE